MKIIVAVTGASGAIYARQVVGQLQSNDKVTEIALVFSDNGRNVMQYELGEDWSNGLTKVVEYKNDDFFTPPASGSAFYDAMIVVPSSVGTLARVALGVADTLITRAADVMIKERRKLIFVLRETPLSLIHIRNMQTLTEAGAVILPASPSFYKLPVDIEELAMSVTDRVMALVGLGSGQGWMEENNL